MELTILMPARNEAATIERCVEKARRFLEENQVYGEVLVIDNGSTDGTGALAKEAGARVVTEMKRGYGSALRRGCLEAKGCYVILGDADDSYDFTSLMPILERLREGCDLVIGNRFQGGIEPGAMPFLHHYLGNPFLSGLGGLLYPCKVHDFHCGLRGYDRKKMQALNPDSDGMEYASEMIIRAQQKKYRIEEVPVKLYPDGRNRKSHLRALPDGLRHIGILLHFRPLFAMLLTIFITFILCIGALVVTSRIPGSAIEKNIKASADYYSSHPIFEMKRDLYNHTLVDNYADSILTNVIYCIDSDKPYESSIRAVYYRPDTMEVNQALADITKQETIEEQEELLAEDGVEYFRYWHGSMVVLRPLFMLFSIEGIRTVLGLLLFGLILLLLGRLWIHGQKETAIILFLGMAAVHIWMCACCIEYITTWLLLEVLLLRLESRERKSGFMVGNREEEHHYYRLFAVSGMLTCFVDFLTTETLTITVPLLLLCLMHYKRGSLGKWKAELLFMIKSMAVWGMAYVGMFLAKWALSVMLLGRHAFGEAWGDAALRISGNVTDDNTNLGRILGFGEQLLGTLWRNLHALFGFRSDVTNRTVYLVSGVVLAVLFAFWYLFRKKTCDKRILGMLIILGAVPYVRFLILRNHSYLHFFFTYRSQMVTVAAIAAIIWVSVKPWGEIPKKHKKKRGRKYAV